MAESRRWWALVLGALGVALVGDLRFALAPGSLTEAGGWWLLALVLLGVAAARGDRRAEPASAGSWQRNDWLAFASIVAVSVAFRLFRLDTYPPPDLFAFEEFQTGGLAAEFAESGRWPSEFPLTNIAPGISFLLFGFSGATLRLPFVLAGCLAPVFLFLAFRRLMGLPAAWFGALLLAACRWAAAAARFADEVFFPLALVALALWLVVRVLQRPRQLEALALGLVTGDFFYAYSGYRVFPPILFVAGLIACRRRPALAKPFVLVVAVWFVLLGYGLVQGYVSGGSILFEAIERHDAGWEEDPTLGDRLQTAVERLRQGWEVFGVEGDDVPTLNLPRRPMLDPLSAGLASLAVLVGLWRWRDPRHGLALVSLLLPFAVCALIPVNFNVQRYFVLLVPLFTLCALAVDDIVRRLPPWTSMPLLLLTAAAVCVFNFRELRAISEDDTVRLFFISPENTVTATLHRLPDDATVELMTTDCGNALEPSHYRWFTRHVGGGRSESLRASLDVDPKSRGHRYWITQGLPEIEVLPKVVRLACPQAQARVRYGEKPVSAVLTVAVSDPGQCHPPPPVGLRGVYTLEEPNGAVRTIEQVDPALMAYTIPWQPSARALERSLRRLTMEWTGFILPQAAGHHEFRVEVAAAKGTVSFPGFEAEVHSPNDDWQSTRFSGELGDQPVPIRLSLRATGGYVPRVRLFWQPPGAAEEIIPPESLRPGDPG